MSKSTHSCSGHHDHAAHADLDTGDGRRRVAIACAITAVFMVVEAIGGLISGSIALIADAAHMFTDSASLALAWIGYWFAAKEPDDTRSFGFGRMRVLAAFTNGLALLLLAVWIMFESVLRLLDPQPVMGGVMLVIAVGGLVINLIAAYVLHGGNNNDINLSGALWHVLGDLLGSVAAIVAAVIIIATSWTAIDPLLSILVSSLVMYAGVHITRRAGNILLQSAPTHSTSTHIRNAVLNNVDGIKSIDPVHAWQLTEDKTVLTLCVKAKEGYCTETLRLSVKQYLHKTLHCHSVTVEVEASEDSILDLTGSQSANDAHNQTLTQNDNLS